MLLICHRWSQASREKIHHVIRWLGNAPILTIGGINALIFPLSIITSIIMARILLKADYGQLVYFYSGVGLLRLLVNLGFGTVLSRDVATAWPDQHRLNQIVYSATVIRILSIITILAVLLLIKLLIPVALFEYMLTGAICASLADFIFAIIAGSRLTWHISLMTAVQPAAYLLLSFGLIVLNWASSQKMMAAYALSFIAMAMLGICLLAMTRKLHWPTQNDIQLSYIKGAVGIAIPSYFASLITQTWSTIIAGSLGFTGQFEHSADFGIAFSIVTLSIAITGPTILTSFFPQASYLYSIGNQNELVEYIRKTLSLFLKLLVWVSILLFTCSTMIVTLFGARYLAASAYIEALTPITLIMGVTPIFTLSLFVINKPWKALIGLSAQLTTLLIILSFGNITIGVLISALLVSSIIGVVVQSGILTHDLKANLFTIDIGKALGIGAVLFFLLRFVSEQELAISYQLLAALFCSAVYVLVAFLPEVTSRIRARSI